MVKGTQKSGIKSPDQVLQKGDPFLETEKGQERKAGDVLPSAEMLPPTAPENAPIIETDGVIGGGGAASASAALKAAASGKIRTGAKPDEKKDVKEPEAAKKVEKEKADKAAKETAEKIGKVAVTKAEMQKEKNEMMKAENESIKLQIEQAELKQKAKMTKTTILESEKSNVARMRYVTDPRTDPMVDYNTRVDTAREKIKEAFQEGATKISDVMPDKPELQSEEINENQAMITLAMQSMTGLMGSLSGRDVGFRASAEAVSKGALEIEKNVAARKKANADIMGLYNAAAGQGVKAMSGLAKEYLSQVGGLEKKAVEEYTDHWNNIESVKNKNDIFMLSQAKAKIEQLKLSGEITVNQANKNIKAINESQIRRQAYQADRQLYWNNVSAADKATLMANVRAAEANIKLLKNKGINIKGDKTMQLYVREYATNLHNMNAIASGNNGTRRMQRAQVQSGQLSSNLGALDQMFSQSAMMRDQSLLLKSEAVASNLVALAKYVNLTGQVPMGLDVNTLDQLQAGVGDQRAWISKTNIPFYPDASQDHKVVVIDLLYSKAALIRNSTSATNKMLAKITEKGIVSERKTEERSLEWWLKQLPNDPERAKKQWLESRDVAREAKSEAKQRSEGKVPVKEDD